MPLLGHFFPEKSIAEFRNVLRQNNAGELRGFLRSSLLQGVALMLLSTGVLLYMGADDFYITVVPFAALLAMPAANCFLQMYKFEMRKRRMEALVPDVLLQASVFPAGHSMEKAVEFLADAGYGPLSSEFSKAVLEMKSGASFQAAMGNMRNRNRSAVLGRAAELLVQGYESGADMGSVFKETAEDLLESNAILRERNSALVVEKYTLLFAGGFIVPVVLGLIAGLLGTLDFAALAELEIGTTGAERTALMNAAMLANALYIAEYGLIASLFIANSEGNLKKAVLYAALLVPLGQIAYAVAQTLWLGGV